MNGASETNLYSRLLSNGTIKSEWLLDPVWNTDVSYHEFTVRRDLGLITNVQVVGTTE